jgi:hypothetical protein
MTVPSVLEIRTAGLRLGPRMAAECDRPPWRDNVTDGDPRHAKGDQRRVSSARAQRPPGEAGGYFYFFGGEATDWLDRAVQAATVNALTLEQWIEEFKRLKKVNAEIMSTDTAKGKSAPTRN